MGSMRSKCKVYGVLTNEVEGIQGVPVRPGVSKVPAFARRKKKSTIGISIRDNEPAKI